MIRSISFFIVLLFGFSSALASSAILCKSASLTEQDLILGDYVRNGGKLPKAARLIDGKLQIFMDVFLEEFSEEFETLQGGYPKGDNFNLENGDSLVSRWTQYSEYRVNGYFNRVYGILKSIRDNPKLVQRDLGLAFNLETKQWVYVLSSFDEVGFHHSFFAFVPKASVLGGLNARLDLSSWNSRSLLSATLLATRNLVDKKYKKPQKLRPLGDYAQLFDLRSADKEMFVERSLQMNYLVFLPRKPKGMSEAWKNLEGISHIKTAINRQNRPYMRYSTVDSLKAVETLLGSEFKRIKDQRDKHIGLQRTAVVEQSPAANSSELKKLPVQLTRSKIEKFSQDLIEDSQRIIDQHFENIAALQAHGAWQKMSKLLSKMPKNSSDLVRMDFRKINYALWERYSSLILQFLDDLQRLDELTGPLIERLKEQKNHLDSRIAEERDDSIKVRLERRKTLFQGHIDDLQLLPIKRHMSELAEVYTNLASFFEGTELEYPLLEVPFLEQ